jgi:hypothetical protein
LWGKQKPLLPLQKIDECLHENDWNGALSVLNQDKCGKDLRTKLLMRSMNDLKWGISSQIITRQIEMEDKIRLSTIEMTLAGLIQRRSTAVDAVELVSLLVKHKLDDASHSIDISKLLHLARPNGVLRGKNPRVVKRLREKCGEAVLLILDRLEVDGIHIPSISHFIIYMLCENGSGDKAASFYRELVNTRRKAEATGKRGTLLYRPLLIPNLTSYICKQSNPLKSQALTKEMLDFVVSEISLARTELSSLSENEKPQRYGPLQCQELLTQYLTISHKLSIKNSTLGVVDNKEDPHILLFEQVSAFLSDSTQESFDLTSESAYCMKAARTLGSMLGMKSSYRYKPRSDDSFSFLRFSRISETQRAHQSLPNLSQILQQDDLREDSHWRTRRPGSWSRRIDLIPPHWDIVDSWLSTLPAGFAKTMLGHIDARHLSLAPSPGWALLVFDCLRKNSGSGLKALYSPQHGPRDGFWRIAISMAHARNDLFSIIELVRVVGDMGNPQNIESRDWKIAFETAYNCRPPVLTRIQVDGCVHELLKMRKKYSSSTMDASCRKILCKYLTSFNATWISRVLRGFIPELLELITHSTLVETADKDTVDYVELAFLSSLLMAKFTTNLSKCVKLNKIGYMTGEYQHYLFISSIGQDEIKSLVILHFSEIDSDLARMFCGSLDDSLGSGDDWEAAMVTMEENLDSTVSSIKNIRDPWTKEQAQDTFLASMLHVAYLASLSGESSRGFRMLHRISESELFNGHFD